MIKQKRGQVFLIAAIIFVISIYSVVVAYNTVKTYPTPEGYSTLSENYKTEYPKVINFATYNGTNVTQAIDNFTITFLQQAKNKDPNFGVFYMFKDSSGNLHIVNTLNNKVLNVQFSDPTTGQQTSLSLLSQNTQSTGNICITGVGCVTGSTDVSNIDTSYYSTNIMNNPSTLRISIENLPFGDVDTTQFTSMTYITSNNPISLGGAGIPQQNVVVTLTQY